MVIYWQPMIFTLLILLTSNVSAETPVFTLTLKNHVFTPARLVIPANKKIKLIIKNEDNLAEEFDSFDLNREKVIFPGRKITLYIGPLAPGTYTYFGEYHPNSAQGKIFAVENSHDY